MGGLFWALCIRTNVSKCDWHLVRCVRTLYVIVMRTQFKCTKALHIPSHLHFYMYTAIVWYLDFSCKIYHRNSAQTFHTKIPHPPLKDVMAFMRINGYEYELTHKCTIIAWQTHTHTHTLPLLLLLLLYASECTKIHMYIINKNKSARRGNHEPMRHCTYIAHRVCLA